MKLPTSQFSQRKGFYPSVLPSNPGCRAGAEQLLTPHVPPKPGFGIGAGHSPLFPPGNLAQPHYPAVLWAWEEKVDLDRHHDSHYQNGLRICISESFYPLPFQRVISAYKYLHSLFLPFGVFMELLLGNSSCLWGLELGDLQGPFQPKN